jgi:tetratricopeptide (TPR) repeat protein
MPTLCELLDLQVPETVQGRSLLPLIMGRKLKKEPPAYSETYYPRYHYGWSELKSLRTTKYKYILAPRPELYDLDLDPREQNNIFNKNRSLGNEFAQQLKTIEEKMSQKGIEDKGPQQLDDETREKLMALGYIGGFTSDAKLSRTENLADPKDKIILYNKIKIAEGASSNREYDKALAKLDEVIKEDPRIIEARLVRANVYMKLERAEEAIEECKEALKIDSEYSAAIFTLARAYIFLAKAYLDLNENYEEAIDLAKKGLKLNPEAESAPLGHYILADIYGRLGRQEDYNSELQKGRALEQKIKGSKTD